MKILFSEEAIDDLVDLDEFLTFSDSSARAEGIISGIQKTCQSLAKFKEQGHVLPELAGYRTKYREVRFKVWRIIYRVDEEKIYIFAVVDSRRDMQAFLERRLLR